MTESNKELCLQEPLLPPAVQTENNAAPTDTACRVARRRSRVTVQNALCLLCMLTALGVLALAAVAKLDEIRLRGFWHTVTEELLSASDSTLGDRISAATFGTWEGGTASPAIGVPPSSPTLTLPRIYYIPREEIVEALNIEQKELERKIFDLYAFDAAKVPAGKYAILPTDLSADDATELQNNTSYSVNMQEVEAAAAKRPAETIPTEPLVLIVHTHGTEAYSAPGSTYYGEGSNEPRSTDTRENVVAVGRVLCEALNTAGIPTVQCEAMHDRESYIKAYERSAEAIATYLEKYPTIRYVFDVHRDSLIRNDRTKLRPVTLYDGKPCAQLMMLIGSDEKGAGEYAWQANLSLAEAIQQRLCADTLGVARPLCLRGASYNQQLATYGLLLEIGSCGNSRAEAENAARAFADAFVKVLCGEGTAAKQ